MPGKIPGPGEIWDSSEFKLDAVSITCSANRLIIYLLLGTVYVQLNLHGNEV